MLEAIGVIAWIGFCLFTFGAALEGWGFWRLSWLAGSGAAVWAANACGLPGWVSALVAIPAALVLLAVVNEIIIAHGRRREL